jgi:hypothetical protein
VLKLVFDSRLVQKGLKITHGQFNMNEMYSPVIVKRVTKKDNKILVMVRICVQLER